MSNTLPLLRVAVGYALPRAGLPSTASFHRWALAALQGAKRRKPVELAIRIVDDIDDAMEHIARYGSAHTDAIVTEDYSRARRFLREVDSSSVMVNTSLSLVVTMPVVLHFTLSTPWYWPMAWAVKSAVSVLP